MIITIGLCILLLVAQWKVYVKMGRQGWESIIPFYSSYVIFDVLYGNGWKFLLSFIPFYNIYIEIKLMIDLAHGFHKDGGFAAGLIFLAPIFFCILGFSQDCTFGDIPQQTTSPKTSTKPSVKKENAAWRLQELPEIVEIRRAHEWYKNGTISEEQFIEMKKKLLGI